MPRARIVHTWKRDEYDIGGPLKKHVSTTRRGIHPWSPVKRQIVVHDAGFTETYLDRRCVISKSIHVNRPSWARLHKVEVYTDHTHSDLAGTIEAMTFGDAVAEALYLIRCGFVARIINPEDEHVTTIRP